jgi:hypothetical protein
MRHLPFILYTAGSVLFLIGTLVSWWRAVR